MRKLEIIGHYLMPVDKTCEFFMMSEEYFTYLLPSKNELFYYEIMIKPYTNVTLRDEEGLEDLILTNSTYFCVKLVDLNNFVVETLYTKRELTSNYHLN